MVKLFIFTILCILTSCSNGNKSLSPIDKNLKYYVHVNKDHYDTVLVNDFEKPDSSFHISASKKFDSKIGLLEINKFTNEPNTSIDGGEELFYEKHIGIFYSRSLTWPAYSKLQTNVDTINKKIAILIDKILADPELCNFPVFDSTNLKIKFTIPKIES